MIITAAMLEDRDACPEQVAIFLDTFGDSAELTPENWETAQAAGLDVTWLARVLSAPASAEYECVVVSARAEYERVTAPAWAEYECVRAAAWAEYERVTVPALYDALAAMREETP